MEKKSNKTDKKRTFSLSEISPQKKFVTDEVANKYKKLFKNFKCDEN